MEVDGQRGTETVAVCGQPPFGAAVGAVEEDAVEEERYPRLDAGAQPVGADDTKLEFLAEVPGDVLVPQQLDDRLTNGFDGPVAGHARSTPARCRGRVTQSSPIRQPRRRSRTHVHAARGASPAICPDSGAVAVAPTSCPSACRLVKGFTSARQDVGTPSAARTSSACGACPMARMRRV